MDKAMINDFRGMIMVFLLLLALILILKTISIDTAKRIYRIYKWTNIRYRELILLSCCIISSTMALACFDDAQRIATTGTSFSNWLELGAMPGSLYHYGLLVAIYIMFPVNFGIFLYKMYHTEKGTPNKRIIVDMVLPTIVPITMVSFHYAVRGIIYVVELYAGNDMYRYQVLIKAGLFLISMLIQIYNTYTLRKGFNFTKLEVKKQENVPELIWEQQNCCNTKEFIQKNFTYWGEYQEIIHKIKRFEK